MRKKLILLLFTLICFTSVAWADTPPQTIDEALAVANDELRNKNDGRNYFKAANKHNKPINTSLWESRRLFVYGQPYGYDPDTGNNRYLGETMQGEAYTNTMFRHDAWAGGVINDRNWILRPWRDPEVKAHLQRMGEQPLDWNNPFNNNPAYDSSIKQGLKEYFKPGGNVQLYFRDDATPWHQYVHVLQPPTKYTWGMGRMWHQKSDGSIWYLTVPMAPLALTAADPDFSVTLEAEKFQNVKPEDKVTSTVTYKLNQDHPKAERAWLRLHHQVGNAEYAVKLEPVNPADKQDANGYVTFQPGESMTYRYTFTVQDASKKIIARINPVDSAQDKDWNNNRDEAVIFSKDNLWVEIIDYTKEAQVGGTATVRARVHNERGELITSRLVWKVNGVIMKDIPNYDVIGTLENSLTFTMPKDSAIVTVEINPDRDRPANESSYEDNKASCTVKPIAVVIPPSSESSKLKIKISAPSRVKAFTKWKYTVTVTTNYPPPPPPPPGGKSPKPPTITMNMSATGQNIDFNIGYRIDDGYQKIIPVNKTDKKVFSAGWGKNTHTFTYEYPATGIYGKPVTVTIKASASSSKGQSASDTAIVKIDPYPIPQTERQLIK
ncbi:Athe_2463 domain-containing protein [Desulforamulus putei]|uniref:Athe_2463 domain-containing protein n=1 Tax=Desulforamulus putei TaxID=74701 RepID=UPI002FDDE18B